MSTIGEWLKSVHASASDPNNPQPGLIDLVEWPEDWLKSPFNPDPADRKAAWDLYTEFRTRIITQPLHFRDGDEKTALDSIVDVFRDARKMIREHGPECTLTATLSIYVFNVIVRPFTARWHRGLLAAQLDHEDGRRTFRAELAILQAKLCEFQEALGRLALDGKFQKDAESGLRQIQSQKIDLGQPISFTCLLGLKKDVSDKFVAAEKPEVDARRVATGCKAKADEDLVGLAISGGGIRSATLALGVVKGLAENDVLKDVDLVSTVSGGGYLGSFLSSYLNDSSSEVGPGPDQQPFHRDGAAEAAPLRFLRNNSRYILPSGFLAWCRMIGAALFGMLSNLVMAGTVVVGAVLLTQIGMGSELRKLAPPHFGGYSVEISNYTIATWLLVGMALLALPVFQNLGRWSPTTAWIRGRWEWICILGVVVAGSMTLFDLIPFGHYRYNVAIHRVTGVVGDAPGWSLRATMLALSSLGALLAARSEAVHRLERYLPRLKSLLFTLLWLAGPALLLLIYLELTRVHVIEAHDADLRIYQMTWPIHWEFTFSPWLCGLLGIGALYSLLHNINFSSPHRFYRNRLCETYLLKHCAAPAAGTPVYADDTLKLTDLRNQPNATAPYHLINAALNLPASSHPELRGRNSDFFLFSKHFCGSPLVGYEATEKWQACDRHLNLGTAMAISGAAAAPHMGMGSVRGAAFLLTLLNVRTHYWVRRPGRGILPAPLASVVGAPGPAYLVREAFGQVDESAAYLNVSDGGHLENLAIYELLRRRCKFIIAIDGECDPEIQFGSLMRLQRFAWIDLGTKIELPVDELRWIAPQPLQLKPRGGPMEPADREAFGTSAIPTLRRERFTKSHFALGRIYYPKDRPDDPNCPDTVGWLLYIKSSMTGDEPDYIQEYRTRHPEFPQETTADQVFEEDQFEAYRRLGRHITDTLFTPEFQSPDNPAAAKQVLSLKAWFQAWADCLVERKST
ncbi:MAG: patatin-like phospholipase family protein [Planctomycetales bacterium]